MIKSQPRAGSTQGTLLLIGSSLPILGAVLLGPVLANVQSHFSKTPGVEALTPVMLTIPALVIALSAPLAGFAVDRLGRVRMLLGALLVYSIFGTAPLYLSNLYSIVISRAGLGLAEAMVMTVCTTLIGDYFEGAEREFWLSLQGAMAALAAAIFLGLGGFLGEFGWRTPFWLYFAGVLMFPLALKLLWEPDISYRNINRFDFALPWRTLAVAYPFGVITGAALLMVPIQLSFILHDLGLNSPAIPGVLSAGNQLAVLAGALAFRIFRRFGYTVVFGVGFFATGAGLLEVAAAHDQVSLLVGGCLSGLGCGVLLVGLINWALAVLPPQTRGIGTGGFNSCVFLGEFLSPLIIIGLRHVGISLSEAIEVCGWGVLALILPGILAPFLTRTGVGEKSVVK